MENPLPCPFCGEKVTPYVVANRYYYIQCFNNDCEVQPEIDLPSNTEEEVIRKWNKRVKT